jgi:uncharacterized damage-inducible protein DinB
VTRATLSHARITESWQNYQNELVRVIAPLTDEQMSLRLVPTHRTLGELAEHIVRARALWVPKVLGDLGWEPMANWDEPGDPTRTAAEVVKGLTQTWEAIDKCLTRWGDESLGDAVSDEEVEQIGTIMGLMEHDMHHGGELAFVLGAYGLETPSL